MELQENNILSGVKITFFGAAQNVTGSKHLVEAGNYKLLLDCGLYQGVRAITEDLNCRLPFDPEKINSVILSHAHLDHCGLLPLMIKNGFAGKIYCTPATAEIAAFILHDAVMVQLERCKRRNRHLREGQSAQYPIYTDEDVNKTLERFEVVSYFRHSKEWTLLNENIRFKFYDAGHILGSAVTVLEFKDGDKIKTLAYTGDLGRDHVPMLHPPEKIAETVGAFVTECTYGNRFHKSIEAAAEELSKVINEAIKNKSKIIVPAFSLGRTQELVYILHKLSDQKVFSDFPIYIDSPLAKNITEVFSRYTRDFNGKFWEDFGNKKESPFMFKKLVYTHSAADSLELEKHPGPMMIITASGMAEGGRVLDHLKYNLSNPQSVILITGYQGENTLGRKLQEGISPINIFGVDYPVKAHIMTVDGFSAHADERDLLEYLATVKGVEKLFLVHTELPPAEAFGKIAQDSYPTLSIGIPLTGDSAEV